MPFSDSWYRVADLHLGLLPGVEVHKQAYRGETWYVLQEPGSGKFFRLRPDAYRFACSLTPDETVAEAWYRANAEYPEQAPDQEEVVQLLSQLHHANLLFFRSRGDHDAIFKRFQQQRGRERLGQLMALLYLRIPLWNPDRFLNRSRRWLSPIFSTPVLIAWVVAMLFFGKLVVENWEQLWATGQGLLAPGNLPLLYLSIFGLKVFHEMAHAIVCKRYGGEVHSMGLMFIVFTPLPYIDASASWSMRGRWQRAYVGAAGMIVELFLASLAGWLWLYTGPGFLNSLAFNLMVAGSVSAVLFNGNPLLRFDAYYILTDLVELPNLYQKASQQWFYYGDRYLFGTEQAEPPARDQREAIWYTTYGLLSVAYRLFIMFAIGFLVADVWLGFGVMMVIMMAFIWVFIPGGRLIKYLAHSPKLMRNRRRALAATLGIAVALVLLIGVLPVRDTVKAPGVVLANETHPIYTRSAAKLVDVHVRDGQWLEQGQPIVTLASDSLAQELRLVSEQLRETEWLYRQALEINELDPAGFLEQVEALRERQATLAERIQALEVRAAGPGLWQGQRLSERLGTYVGLGEALGTLVNTQDYRFVAVIDQAAAAALFGRRIDQGEIRLWSQNADPIAVQSLNLVPFQKRQLPSPALGVGGNGPILTTTDDQGRTLARESFFEMHVQLPQDKGVTFGHGMTGVMRLELDSNPLAAQLYRHLRQSLQRRYGL